MAQGGGQAFGLQDGHLPLDQPGLLQPPHAAQAGGRRQLQQRGQGLVAAAAVFLHQLQQLQVGSVQLNGILVHFVIYIEIIFLECLMMKY